MRQHPGLARTAARQRLALNPQGLFQCLPRGHKTALHQPPLGTLQGTGQGDDRLLCPAGQDAQQIQLQGSQVVVPIQHQEGPVCCQSRGALQDLQGQPAQLLLVGPTVALQVILVGSIDTDQLEQAWLVSKGRHSTGKGLRADAPNLQLGDERMEEDGKPGFALQRPVVLQGKSVQQRSQQAMLHRLVQLGDCRPHRTEALAAELPKGEHAHAHSAAGFGQALLPSPPLQLVGHAHIRTAG